MAPRSPASSEDPKSQEGFPEHGAPAVPAEPQQQELPLEESPAEGRGPDLLADIRKQLDRLEREVHKRPSEPPVREVSPPKADEDDVDWEKELFANPKAAMKKAMDMASSRAEERIRAEVRKDRSMTEFWNEFYRRNTDLRDDHDLVEVVLNRNLSELSDLPVDKGYERLAELTRERIMCYIGTARSRPKARAEGSGLVSGEPKPRPAKEDENIKSLSDILKERRQKRRGQAA